MSRSSRTAAGLLSAALLAGSVAAAAPAAASGQHLECDGVSTWFICDLGANSTGEAFSNERWYRNGVAYSVGNDRWSVKFLCSGQSSVAIGVYYTDSSGVLWSESIDYVCF